MLYFRAWKGAFLLGSGLVLEAMWYMSIYVYFDTSLVLNPVKITVSFLPASITEHPSRLVAPAEAEEAILEAMTSPASGTNALAASASKQIEQSCHIGLKMHKTLKL